MVGIDKIPKWSEYERTLEGSTDVDKNFGKIGDLNKLDYEVFILSINTDPC